ncbi:GroES-like protein [Panus rudis PR-1116 ss-1]|nr:GroES-like protein [Panus rudis PR-1116 ss-1]
MSQSLAVPTTQKALVLHEQFGELRVDTIEVPKPAAGEVLIRVESTAMNPLDYKIQELGLFVDSYPSILGLDASGVVVEIGRGVRNLAVGDRVTFGGSFFDFRFGSYQQYAVMGADITFKIPPNISFDQAATIPIGLATAVNGLYGDFTPQEERSGAGLTPFWREGGRGMYADQPILIFGGSSSVGQYVIQVARLSGFSPIIATASQRNAELLKSLGADHVIDRSLPASRITEEVREITKKPLKIIYDTISLPETQTHGVKLLAQRGILLITLPHEVDKATVAAEAKHVGLVFGKFIIPQYRKLCSELSDVLPRALQKGEIKTNIPEIIPGGLGGILEGLDRLKSNKVSARKLVVRPPETR